MIPGAPKVLWPLYIECSDAEVILGSGPKGAEGGASNQPGCNRGMGGGLSHSTGEGAQD